ncbi:Spore photoproduct lyase family protein OS=Streptomyces fumanus OX=67302 GN=GCM10018772_18590 PE=4 SV=1 [Streptomyces fumanus]
MHHPSTFEDNGSGTLLGLDALTGTAAEEPSFRDSPAARRMLPVREIHAEPAAAESARRPADHRPLPGPG